MIIFKKTCKTVDFNDFYAWKKFFTIFQMKRKSRLL